MIHLPPSFHNSRNLPLDILLIFIGVYTANPSWISPCITLVGIWDDSEIKLVKLQFLTILLHWFIYWYCNLCSQLFSEHSSHQYPGYDRWGWCLQINLRQATSHGVLLKLLCNVCGVSQWWFSFPFIIIHSKAIISSQRVAFIDWCNSFFRNFMYSSNECI
jgi:hypothetical protein